MNNNNFNNINKEYHIERPFSNSNNNNLNNNNFSFNNNFNNLTFNNLNFSNNFNNLTFNNFNFNNNFNNTFNNNLNFYNKNANIAIEELLENIPENVNSDDYFAHTICDERVYTLLKSSTYYAYFKEITNLIQKLRNLIVGNTETFENKLNDFNKLKLHVSNVLRNLNSYLNNYKELYSDFKIDEKTGNISDEYKDLYFLGRLLLIKEDLLTLPKKIFPILYNYENLNGYESSNDYENSDESSSLFSKKDVIIEINNDEDLNKGFNNNIKSIKNKNSSLKNNKTKNKNSSLKNNKIGLGKHKLIVPIINNINPEYQNNCLTILKNTSNNNSNYLNKKTKRNEEESFSNNPTTFNSPSFWKSRFLYRLENVMKKMQELERKGIIKSNEMDEIKKTLYDDTKDFYNYLRDQEKVGVHKIDDHGDIIENNLDDNEKQQYDVIIAAKDNKHNKYFSTKNKYYKYKNNLPYSINNSMKAKKNIFKIRKIKK